MPFVVVFFIGCASTPVTTSQDVVENRENETELNAPVYKPFQLDMGFLADKFFITGGDHHFTDSCTFLFECDCCSGYLFFNRDSTFFTVDNCMSDEIARTGRYSVHLNIIYLNYNNICVSKLYNWEMEIDTSVDEYLIRDTIVEPVLMRYRPKKCNDVLILTGIDNSEIALYAGSAGDDELERLRAESYMRRLDSLVSLSEGEDINDH